VVLCSVVFVLVPPSRRKPLATATPTIAPPTQFWLYRLSRELIVRRGHHVQVLILYAWDAGFSGVNFHLIFNFTFPLTDEGAPERCACAGTLTYWSLLADQSLVDAHFSGAPNNIIRHYLITIRSLCEKSYSYRTGFHAGVNSL